MNLKERIDYVNDLESKHIRQEIEYKMKLAHNKNMSDAINFSVNIQMMQIKSIITAMIYSGIR